MYRTKPRKIDILRGNNNKASETHKIQTKLMKSFTTKAEYLDTDGDCRTIQSIMSEYVLFTGTKLKERNDNELLEVFLRALIKSKKHINLKKSFREIVGIEVTPYEVKMLQTIIENISKGTE